VVRKALYLRRPLERGAAVSADDLVPLRPLGDGVPALALDDVVGRELVRSIPAGEMLRWSDLRG
jgi:sialic acid synthase SpsE